MNDHRGLVSTPLPTAPHHFWDVSEHKTTQKEGKNGKKKGKTFVKDATPIRSMTCHPLGSFFFLVCSDLFTIEPSIFHIFQRADLRRLSLFLALSVFVRVRVCEYGCVRRSDPVAANCWPVLSSRSSASRSWPHRHTAPHLLMYHSLHSSVFLA